MCPRCFCVLIAGKCPACGCDCRAVKRSRPLVLPDGRLRLQTGDIYVRRAICQRPDAAKIWERMYWRSLRPKAKNRTFAKAAALFAMENNWQWPDRELPFMPMYERDYYRAVNQCPMELLNRERTEDAKL